LLAVLLVGEVASAVVVIAGGKQALLACVQALLGEQAVAVVAQLAAQAGGELLLGELAQGEAPQAACTVFVFLKSECKIG
jgi:hypothetical protein